MAEKSGRWFLEIILNVVLLGAVAFVTFAARGEQDRGLAVPLFAGVSPGAAPTKPSATPAPLSLGPINNLSKPLSDLPDSVKNVAGQANLTFQQAWGAMQIWAAGLDGKITQEELSKILTSVQNGWSGTQSARDYLKTVNDRINKGQAEQVVNEALSTIAQQANEKKMLVVNSVMQFFKDNGVSWEQTQQVVSHWVTDVFKLRPLDLWKS